ncbi:MAG: ABC transporter substrate-binding protein, partial [Veillonella sp.]|nr:ABC transporter substrate-binding protein [Veillonella sp.]
MNWKRSMMMLALGLGALVGIAGCGNNANNGMKQVGVIQLVEHPALDAANKGFVQALADQGFKEGETVQIDQQNAQADQSNLNSIAQRFTSDRKDLVLAIATPAAQTMANASHDIPIVGTAITDYVQAKLVKSDDKPGTNVTGTSDASPVDQQVDLILAIKPQTKKIGIVYSSSEVNSQIQAEKMKAYAATKGVEVVEVTVSNVNDIQQAAQNLVAQNVDAVYTPTDNVVASAIGNLVAITDAAKIPVFPAEEGQMKGGGVASYTVDYEKLGYQAGLMAAKILKGEAKPEDMPIETATELKLVINPEKAAQLGLTIPQDLLAKAAM